MDKQIHDKEILEDLIKKLAFEQFREKSVADEIAILLDPILKSGVYKSLVDLKTEVSANTGKLRKEIDELAIKIFRETKDKHPHPAAEIKEYDTIGFLSEEIKNQCIVWASANAIGMLSMDMAKLKKYAIGAAEAKAPLPYVRITKEPKNNLIGDLSAYLTAETQYKAPQVGFLDADGMVINTVTGKKEYPQAQE
jgi:hypothetical protein